MEVEGGKIKQGWRGQIKGKKGREVKDRRLKRLKATKEKKGGVESEVDERKKHEEESKGAIHHPSMKEKKEGVVR